MPDQGNVAYPSCFTKYARPTSSAPFVSWTRGTRLARELRGEPCHDRDPERDLGTCVARDGRRASDASRAGASSPPHDVRVLVGGLRAARFGPARSRSGRRALRRPVASDGRPAHPVGAASHRAPEPAGDGRRVRGLASDREAPHRGRRGAHRASPGLERALRPERAGRRGRDGGGRWFGPRGRS